MRDEAKGTTLVERDLVVSPEAVRALAEVLGTASASSTATLVPYFGAVVGGQATAVEGLGLDLSRALLAGIDYEWSRPFNAGETVHARVFVEDVFTKGTNQFGVLVAEFTGADGTLVQRQSVTFIERGAK
jgi:acyl dehydratase